MSIPTLAVSPPSTAPPALTLSSSTDDVRRVVEDVIRHDAPACREPLRAALDGVSHQQLLDVLAAVVKQNQDLNSEMQRLRQQRDDVTTPSREETRPRSFYTHSDGVRSAPSANSSYMGDAQSSSSSSALLGFQSASANSLLRAVPQPPPAASRLGVSRTESVASAMSQSASPPPPTLRRFSAVPRPVRSVRIIDEPCIVEDEPSSKLASQSFAESTVTFSTSASIIKRGDIFDSVNDLDFVRPIGSGTQATVWLCVDVTSGEERAVKVIDRSHCADTNDARLAEIEVAMRLQHDNVIRLYEVIDDPSAQAVFLVMEYVEDGASGSVDAENGECDTSLSPQQLLDVARGAAEGLQYCHARGVVHGDLKPENLLVDLADDTVRAVLADFGVAKVCEPDTAGSSPLMLPRHSTDFESSQRNDTAVKPDATASIDPRLPADLFDAVASSSGRNRRRQSAFGPTEELSASRSTRELSRSVRGSNAEKLGVSFLVSPTDTLNGEAPPGAPPAAPRRFSVMFVPERRQSVTLPTIAVSTTASAPPAEFIKMPSLKHVGHLLADRTRALSKCHSEVLRAKFAKRGPKTQGGTPAFQAPELLEGGHPTPASDMWALGVTLYALVFKRLPWHGATWSELKQAVCTTPPPFPVSTVSDREQRRWRAILDRLLAKNPMERMTAVELAGRVSLNGSPSIAT